MANAERELFERSLKDMARNFPGMTTVGEVELADGKLSDEQRKYLHDRFQKLIEAVEPDPEVRKAARKRLDEALEQAMAGGSVTELTLRRELPKAKHALEKMGEFLDLVQRHAQKQTRPSKFYQFGQAHGLLSSGLAALEGAIERMEHALDCDCDTPGHDEPSERPTDPPPAETAAPAEQEAGA